MVASLRALDHYPHGPADVSRGVPEEATERLGVEVIRAGAGDQKPLRTEKTHRTQVDLLVACEGFLQTGSCLDEGGGIKDDQVEGLPAAVPFLELVEDIADSKGATIRQPVLFGQRGRPLDGGYRLVDAGHAGGPVAGGMEPPQAGVAKAIQSLRPVRH